MVLIREISRRSLAEEELHRHQKQLYELLEDRTRAGEELARQREHLEEMNARLKEEVTERMHTQEALNAVNADLQRSNKELELFASVTSHDLQEPLHTITSYTELLAHKYQGKLDQKADQYIGYIVDGTSHMHMLINDLLAYSRVGTRAKPFGPVKMDSALDQALNSLRKSHSGEQRDRLSARNCRKWTGDDESTGAALPESHRQRHQVQEKRGAAPHPHLRATYRERVGHRRARQRHRHRTPLF